MKNIFLLLFLFGVIIFHSCTPDNVNTTLHYDGDNFSAPDFPVGDHSFCVKFLSNKLQEFNGKTLDRIGFYVVSPPEKVIINLYNQNSASLQPQGMIYSRELTDFIPNQWNFHSVENELIPSDNEVFWVEVISTHNSTIGSIGCDQGPAIENGDIFFQDGFSEYITYRDFTNQQASINWNIRAYFNE